MIFKIECYEQVWYNSYVEAKSLKKAKELLESGDYYSDTENITNGENFEFLFDTLDKANLEYISKRVQKELNEIKKRRKSAKCENKMCEMCFQDTDLKRKDVKIITEEECILRTKKVIK